VNPNRSLLLFCIATIALSSAASAQPRPDKNWKDWFGHVSAGYSLTQGDISDLLDDGFSISGGATYWPEEWPIGLVLESSWSEFDISRSTIEEINRQIIEAGGEGSLTGGDASSWSLTVNGTWSPSTHGAGFYLTAGVGAYRVAGRVNETGLVFYPPICDPWFWWCTPGGVGPGTVVRASDSSIEFGWNGGVGWAWKAGVEGAQVFIEARYHSVATSGADTTYMPLSIGYRW